MAIKYIIYTSGETLYGTDELGGGSTIGITEDTGFSGLYPATESSPFVYLQAGGSPDPATDTLIGDAREFYYGTVAEGDFYHIPRMHSWDWTNATTYDKVRSLYSAKNLMDKFNYIGDKVDEAQGLEFPRTRTLYDGTVCEIGGTSGIPMNIKTAAYLIGEALLGGRDPEADFEAQNVKVETFGPVRTEFATDKGPMQHIANMIPSPAAWALIRPFLKISTSFSVKKA